MKSKLSHIVDILFPSSIFETWFMIPMNKQKTYILRANAKGIIGATGV